MQICTSGVRKWRSLQIGRDGVVSMLEGSNGRTPGVQGVTGPPSLVQLLYTECTGIVMDRFVGGVQSRTAGVRKCRSLQIVRHDLVNMLEWCNGRTPGVQGATGLRSLLKLVYTQPTKAVRNLLGTDLRESCRSVQQVYENSVRSILFTTAW